MAQLARACRGRQCPNLANGKDGWCDRCRREKYRSIDEERDSPRRRGYNTRWERERELFLSQYPLCEQCRRESRLVSAAVVDHKIPHKGNYSLMWDWGNWQSLCKTCHDRKTMKETHH